MKKLIKYIKTFMNTEEEFHAFVIGFFESIHFLKPFIKPTLESEFVIYGEYHYYIFGRALGFIALLFIILLLVKLGIR